jgi:DNA modification methylase
MINFLQGDVFDKLKELDNNSIDCVVTSPPYWGLRDYGVPGQLGLEPTYQEHIQNIVKLFRTMKPKLKESATVWLNYGDSYAATVNGTKVKDMKKNLQKNRIENKGKTNGVYDDRGFIDKPFSTIQGTLKPKDLVMIPNRIAIALQDDGWWIRSEIIWHKPNPMPESTKDRPTSAHEKIWLITKNKKYYYDADAIKEPVKEISKKRVQYGLKHKHPNNIGVAIPPINTEKMGERFCNSDGKRNKRNVWTITTKPFKDAHFATFPKDLIEPCIKAGCPEKVCVECGKPQVKEFYRKEKYNPGYGNQHTPKGTHKKIGGVYQKWLEKNPPKTTIKPSCDCNADFKPGVVFDPFGGSGTTGIVAKSLNRKSIIIELNPEYIKIAKKRIEKELGLFG